MKYTPALEKTAFEIIDQWLQHHIRFSSFPGIQICIRNQADIVFHKAYGYANRPKHQALTTDHLFHIASHSKSITACMILQLIEQGHLNFSDAIVGYIPELQHHIDVRFQDIILRDLLSHRAGIFRDSDDAGFWRFSKPFLNRLELIEAVKASELVYQPNTRTKYTNIGYALLGVIIENVTGMSYAQAADQLIISKLKLNHMFADYDDTMAGRMASGHSKPLEGGHVAVFKHEPTHALASATGFCAGAADISLFMYEMLHGDKLLSKIMQRELLSLNWPVANADDAEHYGLGLQFDKFKNNRFVGHSGGYPGFNTLTCHWLGTDYTMSILNNSNDSIYPITIMRSMAEIMQKIEAVFDEADLKQLTVTSPFMSPWNSKLLVVTPQKGLSIQLNLNLLCQGTLELQAGEWDDTYICAKENGYESLGEIITLQRNTAGKIINLKWGGETIYSVDDFLQHVQTHMRSTN